MKYSQYNEKIIEIYCNHQQFKKGYFTFATDNKRVWRMFLKRILKDGSINFFFSKDIEGNVTWYEAQVPIEYYSKEILEILAIN